MGGGPAASVNKVAVTAAKPVMYVVRTYQLSPRALCLLVLLAWAAPSAALSSKQSLASAAPELSKASVATRANFVEVAVAELVAAHRAAARHGSKPRKAQGANPRDNKAAAWNKGTQAYIASLHSAAAAARAGASVRLVVDRGRLLRVVVGSRPARQFIVAAPQPKGRAALERAILRRLCALDGCGDSSVSAVAAEPSLATVHLTALGAQAITGTGSAATPLTSYRPATPPKPAPPRLVSALSSSDGLSCAQLEVRHHVLYEHACEALLADVRALVKALHVAARRGVAIDWRMPARPYAQGENYELAVNGHGGTVSLPLPALGQAPELLVDILPWAQGRLFGGAPHLSLTPPSRLVYGAAVAQR